MNSLRQKMGELNKVGIDFALVYNTFAVTEKSELK